MGSLDNKFQFLKNVERENSSARFKAFIKGILRNMIVSTTELAVMREIQQQGGKKGGGTENHFRADSYKGRREMKHQLKGTSLKIRNFASPLTNLGSNQRLTHILCSALIYIVRIKHKQKDRKISSLLKPEKGV